jgi:hypothetical protein
MPGRDVQTPGAQDSVCPGKPYRGGLADRGALHQLQKAFIEHDAFQCGYVLQAGPDLLRCRSDARGAAAHGRRNPRADERQPLPMR